jgi:type IV pilus assembly protein PilY1
LATGGDDDDGFYEASDSATLVSAIDDIFDNISTSTSTFVAPGAAVNQFNRLIHDDKIYFSIFKPNNRPFWNGNMKKYQITNDALLDSNGNEAVDDATGLFKNTAQSFWSDAADGNDVSKGGAAAERSSSATRKVYTYVSGSSSTTLSANDNKMVKTNAVVTTTKLGLTASDTALREKILDWVSGVDLKDYDGDNNFSETRLQYGDPLHSKPVIVTYGGTAAAPDSTIYFGTNEGYIHGVDADDGSEVFSYIPEELLPNLEDLYSNRSATAHPYGMDGTVVVWAHDDNGDNDYYDTTGGVNDHVYLYAGMRRGGKSYYALNVTDRTNPEYMWKVTGGSGTFAELAQTWSIPVRSKVNIDGTTYDVLVMGGGYDDDQDNPISHATRQVDTEGRAVFMINANTGALLWQGALTGVTGANESFTDMKYSIPGEVRVIDINLDGYADMMFAADMGGQVWRFDINNGAAAADLVTGGVIADFGADSDTANNRRFYTTPDIALVKQGASKFLTIALGSGWRAHPLNRVVDDRFYVFRDSYWGSAPGTYTKLTESDLVDVTDNIDGNAIDTAITGGKKGWFITLEHDGEKVLSNSVTVNNQVIFSTYTPETSVTACTASEGTGRTYVVSVFNGRPTVNFDLIVSSDPDNLTKDDRVVTLQRGGIPPEATVLFAPDPVILIGPEMPLSDVPFGDIAQRTYWYQDEE